MKVFTVNLCKSPAIRFEFSNFDFGSKTATERLVIADRKFHFSVTSGKWSIANVILLCYQLDAVKIDRMSSCGFGGSEGAFSRQFRVSKSRFSLEVHHFGDPMSLINSWAIHLNAKYSLQGLSAIRRASYPDLTSLDALRDQLKALGQKLPFRLRPSSRSA